jgi:hypothetical protein
LTNDRAGKKDFVRYEDFDVHVVGGAAVDRDIVFELGYDAELTDVQLSFDVAGAGGTDIKLDVLDDAVSVLTTKAAFLVSAAAESIVKVGSAIANTTAPVINASLKNIAAASKVKLNFDVTGTYTTDASQVHVKLVFVERQDFNPSA